MNVCIHTNKVKKNKNMIRAILFYEGSDNIILNNAFIFQTINIYQSSLYLNNF